MESIRNWLNTDRDWYMGVALYEAHGENQALKDMFKQGPSSFRQKKLLKELETIWYEWKKKPAATEQLPATPVYKPVKKAEFVLPENEYPAEKDPYRSQWLPLYQEMKELGKTLTDNISDEARGEIAFKILDLEQQCMFYWERTKYFNRTGMMPVEESKEVAVPIVDTNKLRQSLMNIRSRISKKKNKLKISPEDPQLLDELARLEKERDAIEKQLKE